MASNLHAAAGGAAPLLSLHAVSLCAGGRRLLDSIDFELGPSGICALVGPNGAGKTLLLRTSHGLLAPDAGEVRYEGRCLPEGDLAFEGQALMFQHASIFRGSVLDNLLVVPDPARGGGGARRERAAAMLARVGLAALSAAPALRLSGGERQRLALARAWLTEPRLMLLDEPTASLDPSATEQVEQLIRDVAASGCRVLMTSHNLGQVARIADEVAFIHRGRLLERQPTASFFAAPRTVEARRFLQGALPWQLSSA